MYLHLGGDKVVKTKDIIGIFDMDTSTVSKNTREYLKKSEKSGDVVTVSYDLPKSFIVVQERKSKKKYKFVEDCISAIFQ